jgi:hypothetical protein
MSQSRKKYQDNYGAYDLDFTGRDLLTRFATYVWREHCDGTPIPRNIDNLPYGDFRARLWYKFWRDYQHGNVSYEFDVDQESIPVVNTSRLLTRFSKEV